MSTIAPLGTPSYDHAALLHSLLVCPLCKHDLVFEAGTVRCGACHTAYQQSDSRYVNMLQPVMLRPDWATRQRKMEQWYKDLLGRPHQATGCFQSDYAPYADLLAQLSGTILDIGGGHGVLRHYLAHDAVYINIEPSIEWLDEEWRPLAGDFPCLRNSYPLVRGVGEQLPFRATSFDAVVCFWSLNHVNAPESVLQQIHRVSKEDAIVVLVLEDMEPTWLDLLRSMVAQRSGGFRARHVRTKARTALTGRQWPTQEDHIRLSEADLRRWCDGRFHIAQRWWAKQYLTLELRKKTTAKLYSAMT